MMWEKNFEKYFQLFNNVRIKMHKNQKMQFYENVIHLYKQTLNSYV
jgi:hypothetical protein